MAGSAAQLCTVEFDRPPEWRAIPELLHDKMDRMRAARFIGQCATTRVAEVKETVEPPKSLYELLQDATEDNSSSREAVKLNSRTDMVERVIKAGVITEVDVTVNASGEFSQHGHDFRDIQQNALKLLGEDSVMGPRAKTEVLNLFRFESAHRAGLFNQNSAVTFSLVPEGRPEEELQDIGFFTETMSCAIQRLGYNDDGTKLIIETAFVSGITSDSEGRFDIEAVKELALRHGVNLEGKTVQEILETPFLIPNETIPYGVVDVVREYDEIAMKQTGASEIFFGQELPRENYVDFKTVCRQRFAEFEDLAEEIADQLICEVASRKITSPLSAIKRLAQLSQQKTLNHSIHDERIDPRVFGHEAARHIEMARYYYAQGSQQEYLIRLALAQRTAKSSSCPNGPLRDMLTGLVGVFANGSGEDQVDALNLSSSVMYCVRCPNEKCRKLHEKIEKVDGRFYCKNPKCKLSNKSDKTQQRAPQAKTKSETAAVINLFGERSQKVKSATEVKRSQPKQSIQQAA